MAVQNEVKVWETIKTIPTYGIGAPGKNPLFLEKRVYQGSSGKVYPYPVIDKIEVDSSGPRLIIITACNDTSSFLQHSFASAIPSLNCCIGGIGKIFAKMCFTTVRSCCKSFSDFGRTLHTAVSSCRYRCLQGKRNFQFQPLARF